jgi:hypothetical protein
MKNLTKVLALVAVAMVLLTSCHSTHSCPAYGKVTKPSVEKVS